MIKIENTQVVGWEPAIRGMRNPKNSWDRMDSCYPAEANGITSPGMPDDYIIGPNDHKLMMSLAKGGPVHAKYRRMITVYVDITAPLYWWKEFDTYKIGTVANSCSTMHKIHDKEFTLDDFSCEQLLNDWSMDEDIVHYYNHSGTAKEILECMIAALNHFRNRYLEVDADIKKTPTPTEAAIRARKAYWQQMIQLLPSSYNQKRTIMLNYEVLASIYPMRRNHKLDEWRVFCDWIDSLPYSAIIVPEMYSDEELEE